MPSLSARRAWIEIHGSNLHTRTASGRSPQGERGLKLLFVRFVKQRTRVALRKESVD